jgi:hypothetical protein
MFKKKNYNSNSDTQNTPSSHTNHNQNQNVNGYRGNFRRPRVFSSSSASEASCEVICQSHKKGNYLFSEFLCHLPMAILALSICILVFVFINSLLSSIQLLIDKKIIYINFFHISHYIHILCASYASFYFFGRNSDIYNIKKNIFYAIISFLNATFFCTIADIVLPSLGGMILGKEITMHICFFCPSDFFNVTLFSIFGILASFILLLGTKEYSNLVAKKVHLFHVWFGALSALLYINSQIEIDPVFNSGLLFILLFFSVVVPCILSDIVIPFFIGNLFLNQNKNYMNRKINY